MVILWSFFFLFFLINNAYEASSVHFDEIYKDEEFKIYQKDILNYKSFNAASLSLFYI